MRARAREAEMESRGGRFVDLRCPDPASFDLKDVACGLARTCRYGGHTARFYSVAEHACLVSYRLQSLGYERDIQLAGLHHDDAEAYIGDITRPVQFAIGRARKKRLEAQVFSALCEGLRMDLPFGDRAIKEADEWALSAEAFWLMRSKGRGWYCEGYYDAGRDGRMPWRLGLDPDFAMRQWLTTHQLLLPEREHDDR